MAVTPQKSRRATYDKGLIMNNLLGYRFLIPMALLLGFAPFFPRPHIVEKIGMLMAGTLHRPIDVFDLLWHAWPFVGLAYRLGKDSGSRLK
jgi:hypothetical protein